MIKKGDRKMKKLLILMLAVVMIFSTASCGRKDSELGKYDDDKAAECLAELLRMQEEPIRILAALGKTLRQLYTARLAIDGGKDVLWLKDLWRMKADYPAKKLMQSARGVRRSWCREAVKRCQTLDHRMKSERNMDSEGELKLFLMELAGVK